MTLDEIKTEMNRVQDNLDPLDLIEQGWRECINWVLLDLLPTIDYPFPWHTYPKEKPPKDGYYLASWGFEVPIVVKFEKRHFNLAKVKAWAELPALYKGEAK